MKYMRHIKITDKHIKLAKKMSSSMGTLNNSITKGQGNIIGFLGEIIVAEYLNIVLSNTYDYDLIYKNKKIDVKSKRVTTPPKDYYECSIAALNTKQKCDLYVFTRIKNDLSAGWIVGQLNKKEYLNNSKFLKKGEVDSDNNWKVLTDCYNLPINKLKDIEELK
uniref:Uncharacterized protein n=1 Tax=Virus NIOZ-UU157 TaxID=2763269 RepID=A0A7S9STW9_9VIRU|nr:MAG: hypothetical protein NIOZUU157_00256 [Virus NIOZ-UU157]